MAKTTIEWTDFTWNPWHGCKKVSDGCKNCYMFRDKKRYGQDPTQVVRSTDKTFYAPLKLKEPQRVFTCSWSDFFIEEADEWRDEAFAIIALTPHITYQVLTKRPERMLEYFNRDSEEIIRQWHNSLPSGNLVETLWSLPLPNVWLGVSVEDEKTADERIPLLLKTPAAVRFLSVEPLLGPVDLPDYLKCDYCTWSGLKDECSFDHIETECFVCPDCGDSQLQSAIDWVIVGGESGPNRRVAKLEWIESIVAQCQAASVPVFVKQIELNGKVEKNIDNFPKHLQIRQFPEVK